MRKINKEGVMNIAQKAAVRLGLNKTNATPHDLRLHMALDSNSGYYKFNVAENLVSSEQIKGYSRGLADRDVFLAIGWNIGVLQVPIFNGKEYPEAAHAHYFGDPQVFTQSAAGEMPEYMEIDALWNGKMNIQTNKGRRLEDYLLKQFRKVFTTQTSATTLSEFDGADVEGIGATIRFAGGDKNYIEIKLGNLPKKYFEGKDGEYKNYIEIYIVGALIDGGSSKTTVSRNS